MGLNSDAEIVYGIPVLAFSEEDYEPTGLWDEEDCDWISLPGDLDIAQYGHYEDPVNHRAILTLASFETLRADCWEPTWLNVRDMDIMAEEYKDALTDELLKRDDTAQFLSGPMGWFLVSSYG